MLDNKNIGKGFPTTRYQGSKRKILPWLYENLNELKFDSVLDCFGGTAAVSYLFKQMGKEITYNDSLKFNSIIGKALIENNSVFLEEKESDYFLLQSKGQKEKTFIQNVFKGIYYLPEENTWLDDFQYNLVNFQACESEINYKKAIAQFAVFQSCLTKRPFNLFHRKNLNLRLNDVERNFGNKVTWERSFEEQFLKYTKEANKAIFSNSRKCKSINYSAFDIPDSQYDLVYIDSPYVSKKGTNETLDYLNCYHFLEGLVNYDNWHEFVDFNSKNKRFKKELFTNHFNKKEIKNSFERLFYKFNQSTLVVSYKENSTPSIKEIVEIMKKFKKNVHYTSMHYKYALNKQNGNSMTNREVLIIGI